MSVPDTIGSGSDMRQLQTRSDLGLRKSGAQTRDLTLDKIHDSRQDPTPDKSQLKTNKSDSRQDLTPDKKKSDSQDKIRM